MKLEIYHEEKETVVEEPVRLKLEKISGGVELVAVDKDGNVVSSGHLLFVSTNGTIKRWSHINDGLGFQLDADNKIKETK